MTQTPTQGTSVDAVPFGTVFGETMAVAHWEDGSWSAPELSEVAPFQMHPAAHVLHYGSACFEGLKAHRGEDGVVRIFRLDRHVERLRASAERLYLPAPSVEMATAMIVDTVRSNRDDVPDPPGSLYLRPTLVGTAANIGAAGSPTSSAMLFVLSSPVGDYFPGGMRPLRVAVETDRPRTTPQFGSVKTGANYAMALGVTMEARALHGVDQVLFMPGGTMQETGASNVMMMREDRIITPAIDGTFLEGVTRDSILMLAADRELTVEERPIGLDELIDWCQDGEIALSGTAAVLAPVGTLVVDGVEVTVGDGEVGEATRSLRQALIDAQTARVPDIHGWNRIVD